jgi:hypothetical protein
MTDDYGTMCLPVNNFPTLEQKMPSQSQGHKAKKTF